MIQILVSMLTRAAFITTVVAILATTTPRPVLGATADDVHAGDVLRTLTVGTAADCSPDVGTSLAVVQGSKVDLPQHPVLLVTSCFASGGSGSAKTKRSTLYFLDPASGAVVKSFQTRSGSQAFAPGRGWAALALAADRGVLYGCGDEGSVYSIDYSVLNTVVDGTVTAVTKPTLLTSCGGLAWDPDNKSLYAASAGTVFHFPTTGTATYPASFGAPAGCTVSGLSVSGGVLTIACSGNTAIARVDKLTGAALGDHATVAFKGSALADVECDPVSFAGSNVDAVWSKISATQQVQAFRVPGGTCGLPPAAVVFAPAACPDPPLGATDPYRNPDGTPKDSDGDGLWDCAEHGGRWPDGKPGIDFDGDGTRDVTLCVPVDTSGDGVPDVTECADPTLRDVFVEADFMEDPGPAKSHRPDPLALLSVRQAFASAPVPNGVRLHVLVDEAIPHADTVALPPCTANASGGAADFDALKKAYFGTASERSSPQTLNAKRFAFRYFIFAHMLVGSSASGCAEVPGDDGVVSLGGFGPADQAGHKKGTTDQQAGTFMHELGHTLGLRHGGGDNINCKPNYLSVMSYARQFADLITNRPLDYARGALPTLNESSMSETAGIGTLQSFPFLDGSKTVHSVPTTSTPIVELLGAVQGTDIDWNGDGDTGDGAAAADINKILASGCDGSGTTLVSYDDWQALQYNARATLEFAGGVLVTNTPEPAEKTAEQELASFQAADRDGDGVPDAYGCGRKLPSTSPCAIDIKPGDNPAVLSKSSTSNVAVAILSSPEFDPVSQVVRETLTLNEYPVKLNNQDSGTCSAVQSTGGRKDLVCQFPAAALPLGSNYSILEGLAIVGGTTTAIRARDFVIVVK